ncbi:MAG: hypothetical protein FJ404_15410 [Verrucomicrobia bacterium]|nr:hypothetical protein [Verrucomicrobiota bacterium]
MKTFRGLGRWLVTFALALSACQKQDPVAQLEKTADLIATPAVPEKGAEAAPVTASPSAQVKSAIADYKAGNMEDAVTRLQLLRSTATLSPQQRMAMQDSIAAIMAEIYALAAKGDQRAIAAVAQYERMQTRR